MTFDPLAQKKKTLLYRFESYYKEVRSNRWHWYFSIFCRVLLAYAFIVAGFVKIFGERFASGLAPEHPMGAYLVALYQTGFYYTFIGYVQVLAALLLLFNRTVLLGALLYLPIIVNIWILSFATRFDGSFITSPLMVLANLYILTWHYDRIRYLLPFKKIQDWSIPKKPEKWSNRFPFIFFGLVILTFFSVVFWFNRGFEIMPHNSHADCMRQFKRVKPTEAQCDFCDCIHVEGNSLDSCLVRYERKP